ncbi:conjugal transfer protein TrbD [Luteibacter sp. PPL201]|jgi:type IV secretion system protein VirB3|uniref:Conjugal transfer protein TrbD n=1 Tax=Luteibacter sahnii TaxID=3021977 RepID=A0ABT6BEA4_9GAMM|nr:conjugal transfer protein TrbD [Luteibacter sp. PPL193]MDY1548802.1 conjugal transfer protein TrbD [Luteibacter sp. PPL193]
MRTVPIRRAGNRDNLVLGGDRELVLFTGLLAGALIFSAHDLKAAVFGGAMWVLGLQAFRIMAKADPKMRFVYLRQRRYRKFYPARSTPFRDNGPAEQAQYR